MVDVIPFVPRLDLWWLGNVFKGTLSKKFAGMKPDEISRAQGWACYHMVPNFADVSGDQDVLHRSIGLFNFKQSVYGWRFNQNIEVKSEKQAGQQIVEYLTPLGVVRTVGGLTEEMKRAGASLGWVQEHLIKKPEDYKIAGYIFENIEVFPQYKQAQEYMDQMGEWGVVAAGGPSLGASPMHLIQKELFDATRFFYCERLIRGSSGLALFIAESNDKQSWINVGRSFERVVLKTTSLNIKNAHMNMPCEEIEIRTKLQKHLGLKDEHPLLLLRIGYSNPKPKSYLRSIEEVMV